MVAVAIRKKMRQPGLFSFRIATTKKKTKKNEIWFVVFGHRLMQRNKQLYLNFHLRVPLYLDHTCIKLPILMFQVESRVWLQSIPENQHHFDKNNKCQKHLDFRRLLPIFSKTSFLKQKSRF